MSQYVVIQKNGVTIGEFSRNTSLYQAVSNLVPYDDFKEFNASEIFESCEKNLQDQLTQAKKCKKKSKKIFKSCSTLEDKELALESVNEYKEIIDDLKYYINICQFYIGLSFDKDIWTWSIG